MDAVCQLGNNCLWGGIGKNEGGMELLGQLFLKKKKGGLGKGKKNLDRMGPWLGAKIGGETQIGPVGTKK